jgi:2Fe-2S ferredoxin
MAVEESENGAVKLTFVTAQGQQHIVNAEAGLSVMRAALDNGIDGILADCGGAMTCGTCHVYVDENWHSRLEPMGDDEEATVEFAVDIRDNSRLSCQILLSSELDGLIVHIPKSQF